MVIIARLFIAAIWIVLSVSFSTKVHRSTLSAKDSNWKQKPSSKDRGKFAPTVEQTKRSSLAYKPLYPTSTIKGKPKPLTPKQLKQQEKFIVPPRPRLAREFIERRLPLANLTVGQQFKGKILSVAEFGLFVDIGASKDGLVHIKDTSDSYFIEKSRLDRIFSLGQLVDVWIKFVDPQVKKLGLQMYPPTLRSESIGVSLSDLEIGSQITGKVVKFSAYGVYLDVGAGEDLAFLPKRKIKVPPRMRFWQPWEIIPMGTEVNCLVHEVDKKKGQVSLTTYEIHEWDDKLPMRLKEGEGHYSDMIDTDENLGGTVEANNIRLRREYANVTFEDVMGENEEDQDPDAELQRVKDRGGVRGGNVVMDDFAGEHESEDEVEASPAMAAALGKTQEEGKPSRRLARVEKTRGLIQMESQYDLTVDELWEVVAGEMMTYVTLSRLLKWDKMKFYLAEGMITAEGVEQVMKNAGSMLGRLYKEEFENFLELLADAMSLKDREGKEAEQWVENMPFRELPDNPLWVEEVWKYLTRLNKRKARLTFTDVLAWPAVSWHLEMKLLTMISVERIFRRAAAVEDGRIGHQQFSKLVEQLLRHVRRVYVDHKKPGYNVSDQDDPAYEEMDGFGLVYEDDVSTTGTTVDEGVGSGSINSEGDLQETRDVETVSKVHDHVRQQFIELANGKTFVSLKNLKKWDLIQDMMEKNVVTESKLKELLDSLTPNRKLQEENWADFCYALSQLNQKFDAIEQEKQERLAPSRITSDGIRDVNVDSDFRLLAKGRTAIRFEELMQYPLIESLIESKQVTYAAARRLIVKLARKSGAVKKNEIQREAVNKMEIDVDLFNSILVEIVRIAETEQPSV